MYVIIVVVVVFAVVVVVAIAVVDVVIDAVVVTIIAINAILFVIVDSVDIHSPATFYELHIFPSYWGVTGYYYCHTSLLEYPPPPLFRLLPLNKHNLVALASVHIISGCFGLLVLLFSIVNRMLLLPSFN